MIVHCYHKTDSIKAISFDMDDTLYDNRAIMPLAEQAFIGYLQSLPHLSNLTSQQFSLAKAHVVENEPQIHHNVELWRKKTTAYLLTQAGLAVSVIPSCVESAMEVFLEYRHKVNVPEITHQILNYLANKFPLITISNGNADLDRLGLKCYFQFSLRAGADGLAKPSPALFNLAAKQLGLQTSSILHVGDNLYTDIFGAVQSGMRACWLNASGHRLDKHPAIQAMPYVEISDLAEIKTLL